MTGAVTAARCKTTPAAPVVTTPSIKYEQKLSWILQLEDRRILKLPDTSPAPPPPPPVQTGKKGKVAPPPPPPSAPPDLTVLLKDAEPRIRRRAALAMGRVGLADGIPALAAALADGDPDVRAMSAFALGLIGDKAAEAPLTPVLADPAPLVRGRAAEALGLIDATGAAAAIGKVAAEYARSPAVSAMAPDDETWPAPEAEAFKLAIFSLVRLKAFDPLAGAVLNGGQPATTWWPVAYALQRIGDPKAAPALVALLEVKGRYTAAFAARGLGVLKHTPAAPRLTRFLEPKEKAPIEVVVSAVRALGQMQATGSAAALATVASAPGTDPNVRLEALTALAAMKASEGLPVAQDLLTDEWPTMRAAAVRAAAAIDPEAFTFVLSGLEPDRDWHVRAALADVLGGLAPAVALDRARLMLQDEDKRVLAPVLGALVQLKAPDASEILIRHLKDPDFVVRSAAASGLGTLKPDGGAAALRDAFEAALPDSAYGTRGAILQALVAYGPAEATPTLKTALTDKDWAIRVRAAELLKKMDPTADLSAMRPAPGSPPAPYDDVELATPQTSPHAFVETARGTIEFELAVLDAPQTARNFMNLARKGYFNGLQIHRVVPNFVVQDGDPRGDGEGGPGYTIRDEINDRPYLRGAVGMALDWRDTGGSQFFITHSPQPHLDARYTVFGHVVNGMDVVDRIQQGDTIQRIRVWDGKGWQ